MTLSNGRSGLARAALACLCALPVLAAPARGGARAQEAAFAVQDVTLSDVAIDLNGTRLTAPVLTASGTGLSKEALFAILSADGKEPWSARLARLDAGSLAIPELHLDRTSAGARQSAVYRDVVARGVHAGRVSELSAAGASLSVAARTGSPADAGTPSGTGSYGRMRAEEVDLAALARLFTEPGDGKGPWQRLLSVFSVDGIAFTNAQHTRVGLDRLSGRDISGRQVPAAWNGAIDILKGFDLDGADPAVRARSAGSAADMMDAVSVGGLEAVALRIQDTVPTKDENGRDQEPADIAIGRLAYGGSDGSLALSDLSFTGAGARTTVARLGLSGFSLQPTIATLRRMAKAAPQAPASGTVDGARPVEAGPSQADLRRLTPVIGTLTLSGFGLDLKTDDAAEAPAPGTQSVPPRSAVTGDPLAKPAPDAGRLHLALRDATMTFGPPQDGVPTASRMTLQGLTLPASLFAGAPVLGSLGAYGYRDLDLDLAVDSAWNEVSKEVALRDVSIKGRGMGVLQLSGTIGGIGPDVFDSDAAISGLALLSATAKALTLRVENGGLYERFIDATAKSLSLKPDELRKEYVTACMIGIPVILGNSPAAKTIGAAMGQFAAKPGTLSISAKARNGTGLGVVDFSTTPSPAAMLDKLDVTAKAE